MVTDDYRDRALEQLRRATTVTHRPMFGGVELLEAPDALGEWVDEAVAVAGAMRKGGR